MNLINIEKQKHELECLRTDMYENHELMEKQALSDLIYGYAIEKNELESCSNILRVKPDATYRLALMEIDDYFSKLYTDTGEPENTLVNYRVMHILENHARREDGTHIFRPVRLNEKCFIIDIWTWYGVALAGKQNHYGQHATIADSRSACRDHQPYRNLRRPHFRFAEHEGAVGSCAAIGWIISCYWVRGRLSTPAKSPAAHRSSLLMS